MHGVSTEINSQISYGYRLATGRSADAATIALLRHYYEQELDRFSSDKAAADKLLQIGEYPSDASIPKEIQAALTLLSNLLLNLDAAITRG